MSGLFSKLNKRLPSRVPSGDAIPIARVIHNQPVPENASPKELDTLVTTPSAPFESRTLEHASASVSASDAWITLSDFLNDPLVTDIFISQPDSVNIRKAGHSACSTIRLDESHYRAICEDVENQLKTRCTEENTFLIGAVNSPLPARVSLTHPELNGTEWFGIHLRIPRLTPTFYDLIKAKMLPAPLASWLTEALASHCVHVVVCGAPHSGKTTLTATLTHAAPSEERIVAIEAFPELFPPSRRLDRLCYQFAVSSNAKSDSDLRQGILEIALKTVPDRIVITNAPGSVSIQRALHSSVPTVVEFTAAAAEPVIEYLQTLDSPLPIVLLETQLHEKKPVLRQAVEIASGKIADLVAFHSVTDEKRRWIRSTEPSIVRDLLLERGQDLKIGPTLLDPTPADAALDESSEGD